VIKIPNPRSTILIVSSCWWAFPARLAMAFASIGHRVEAICPAHHPLSKTKAVSNRYHYSALGPLKALSKAIKKSGPALIVPCDDRAVVHLHELHGSSEHATVGLTAIIERSLGNRASFQVASRRTDLIAAARSEGIQAPETFPVSTSDELKIAIETIGLPAVMKVDGTWGGLGVRVVHSLDEANATLQAMSRPLSIARALKRLLVDRDPFFLLPMLKSAVPVVNIQRFVAGTPANTAVACWNGEMLASISVAAVRTRGAQGASTIVRVLDKQDMLEASATLVRRLGLSGFCGFDFVLDDSGSAHLIEMNARTTPISHLPLAEGRNLVTALATRLDGITAISPVPAITKDTIAFFPQAWLLEPNSELLCTGHHDVPWAEQALVRELMKLPWPERNVAARLLSRMRSSSSAEAVSVLPTHYTLPATVDITAQS
jgi:carbamoylphosphate synthase large subunit